MFDKVVGKNQYSEVEVTGNIHADKNEKAYV